MAKIDIKEFNKLKLEELKNMLYAVNVNFETKELYDKFVEEGFNAVDFEEKNNSRPSSLKQIEKNEGDKVVQVLINDKPYENFNVEKYSPHWVKITHINFGKYSFDIEELGELLNELMEAKKFKEKVESQMSNLSNKLSQGLSLEEAYKEVYGIDLKK